MTFKIHQLLAGADTGDAITNYAFEIRRTLLESGIESDIFAPAQNICFGVKDRIQTLSEFESKARGNDILLYHFSVASRATDVYVTSRLRKVLCYHNITPEKYFQPYSDSMASLLRDGREELKILLNSSRLAVAVSEFNRKELEQMGCKKSAVMPLAVTREYLETPPSKKTLKRMQDKKTNILFVGRIAPNKRFDDLILTFARYHNSINSDSRLILAGSYSNTLSYYESLKNICRNLNVTDSVVFTGKIPADELVAYYRTAHAFLCLSEHEGFCLPLIESMFFSVPVFALEKASVSETMGNAGVLINKMDYRTIAELINYVISNPEIKNKICERQKNRLEKFSHEVLKDNLQKLINMVNGN